MKEGISDLSGTYLISKENNGCYTLCKVLQLRLDGSRLQNDLNLFCIDRVKARSGMVREVILTPLETGQV